MEPPGRFLAKDPKRGGLWYGIGSDRAREKASQALRENSQRIREEIEQETMQKHAEDSLPPVPSLQHRPYPHMDHHHAGAYSYGMPHPHLGHHHPVAVAPGPAPGWGYPYYPANNVSGSSGGQGQPEQHPPSGTHHVYSAFPSTSARGYGMAPPLSTGPPLPSIPIQHHDHRVKREEHPEDAVEAPTPYTAKNNHWQESETRAASESDEMLLSAAESWPLVAHAVSMSPITKSQYATLNTQEKNDASMATPAPDRFMQGLQHIYSATSFDPVGATFSNEEMHPAEDCRGQQTRGNNLFDGETPREAYQSKRRLSLSYVAKEEADKYPKAPKLQDSYEEQDPTEPLDLNMESPSSPHPSMLQQPIFLELQQGQSDQHQHVCSLTPVGASCFSALEDMLRYVGYSSGGDSNMEDGTFGGFPTNVSTTALAGDGSFSDASRRGSIGDDSSSELRDSPVMYSPRAA